MDFKRLSIFLTQLSTNNNKAWFDENRKEYELLRTQWVELITVVLKGVSEFDESVRHLEPKNCMFRINRDIRFAKDKSPYKTNFSLIISEGGKKLERAGYYFHFEPKEVFAGGGIYMPGTDALKWIRQEMDYNQDLFLNILKKEEFSATFGQISGSSLKTMPKGYSSDHPLANYLKQTSFLVQSEITPSEIQKMTDPSVWLIETFKNMYPLTQFINKCLRNSESF